MKRRTLLRAALGGAVVAGTGIATLWRGEPHARQASMPSQPTAQSTLQPALPASSPSSLQSSAWSSAQAAPSASGLREFVAADLAFGTTVSLKVLHADEGVARQALRAALDAVIDIDRLMSLYRSDSQLSQLNRHGRLAQPDPRLLDVLQHAQALSRRTSGAFDVTVQPLWVAAAAGHDTQAARARVDWRRLSINAQQVSLQLPGMAVTLNGIAQGYGVDVALAALRRHGIEHALLDTGEFAALGRRDDGQPWILGVQDPRNAQALAHSLVTDGRCMATSGDYETRFGDDHARHHIFDPATGESPQELASVTVLAPTGLQADGLSTAMMVIGAERSLALAASMPGVDVLCITKTGKLRLSAGFPPSMQG